MESPVDVCQWVLINCGTFRLSEKILINLLGLENPSSSRNRCGFELERSSLCHCTLSRDWRMMSWRSTGSPLALLRGDVQGGVGTQIRSGIGVWKLPGC